MPARKRTPPRAPRPKTKRFRASGRSVTIDESEPDVTITIDGQSIPGTQRLADGTYHAHFLPFRVFASAEALGRVLAAHADSTFVLTPSKGRGSGGHGGEKHESKKAGGTAAKGKKRGHS